MSARRDARAGDASYREPRQDFAVGDAVMTTSGRGVIEFIARSTSMDAIVYTVAIDTRIKLRLIGRDLTYIGSAP